MSDPKCLNEATKRKFASKGSAITHTFGKGCVMGVVRSFESRLLPGCFSRHRAVRKETKCSLQMHSARRLTSAALKTKVGSAHMNKNKGTTKNSPKLGLVAILRAEMLRKASVRGIVIGQAMKTPLSTMFYRVFFTVLTSKRNSLR